MLSRRTSRLYPVPEQHNSDMARLTDKWIIATLHTDLYYLYTLTFICCLNVEELGDTSLKTKTQQGCGGYNPSIQEHKAEVLPVQGQHQLTM